MACCEICNGYKSVEPWQQWSTYLKCPKCSAGATPKQAHLKCFLDSCRHTTGVPPCPWCNQPLEPVVDPTVMALVSPAQRSCLAVAQYSMRRDNPYKRLAVAMRVVSVCIDSTTLFLFLATVMRTIVCWVTSIDNVHDVAAVTITAIAGVVGLCSFVVTLVARIKVKKVRFVQSDYKFVDIVSPAESLAFILAILLGVVHSIVLVHAGQAAVWLVIITVATFLLTCDIVIVLPGVLAWFRQNEQCEAYTAMVWARAVADAIVADRKDLDADAARNPDHKAPPDVKVRRSHAYGMIALIEKYMPEDQGSKVCLKVSTIF